MKFTVEHLSKSFGEKRVLEDINFTFDQGKIYGLLGRNGAGKPPFSTALTAILNMMREGSALKPKTASAHPSPRT